VKTLSDLVERGLNLEGFVQYGLKQIYETSSPAVFRTSDTAAERGNVQRSHHASPSRPQ